MSNPTATDLEQYLPFIYMRCRSIRIYGFETSDIKQEAVLATLEYLHECIEKNIEPSRGAIRNIINRHFFRLIRDNVTFEGCSESSKKLRRAIKNPFSTNMFLNYAEENEVLDVVGIYDMHENETSLDIISNIDIVDKFYELLTPMEKVIFEYMLLGIYKPRHICEAMYGKKNLCASKTISNHTIKIRHKFEDFWLAETGKVICLN